MEVYALVGPSGTGKSHRAAQLAHKLGAELIVDDGLIIHNNQIVTGLSAKKQSTRIGAIKTALFMDEAHANNARNTIKELNVQKVLILGTSNKMVEKIAARLNLHEIGEYIQIEQIASGKEIRKARTMRTQHSKHVIPAPAVEVRKSLPETIIDPLHVFLKRKGVKEHKSWLEQSVIRPTFTMYGKLFISPRALETIVTLSTTSHPSVRGIKRSHIHKNEQGLEISLDVILGGPQLVLGVAGHEIQQMVKQHVENMTGLNVNNVHVTVVGLKVG